MKMAREENAEGLGGGMLTSDARGQYSDAVLNELESQNDQQVDGILGKVKILKDVRRHLPVPRSPAFANLTPIDDGSHR